MGGGKGADREASSSPPVSQHPHPTVTAGPTTTPPCTYSAGGAPRPPSRWRGAASALTPTLQGPTSWGAAGTPPPPPSRGPSIHRAQHSGWEVGGEEPTCAPHGAEASGTPSLHGLKDGNNCPAQTTAPPPRDPNCPPPHTAHPKRLSVTPNPADPHPAASSILLLPLSPPPRVSNCPL